MHSDNTETSEVTVIIPNYNNANLLSKLLDSLKNIPTRHETIIVDNNSTDDSLEVINAYSSDITLIKNDRNMGFAYAVNQAIRKATTDYVFLLNNDTEVDEEFLEHSLELIKEHDNVFAVASKMIQYHDKTLIDDAGDEYNLLAWSKKRGLDQPVTKYDTDCEVFGVCAGAALYKKDVFDEIGLFDEKFESYVEDMDLNFRARMMGYKAYYSSKSVVYHHGSATTGSRYNAFKIRLSARNNVYLIWKNMPVWMKIINSPFMALGFLIKFLYFKRKGYSSDYEDGVLEAIATRNKIGTNKKYTLPNMMKIEWQMIKNTIKYPF